MSSKTVTIELNHHHHHSHKHRHVISELCVKQPHQKSLDDLCRELNLSDIHTGLTNTQVNQAQTKYGLNQLAPTPQPGYLRLFFVQTFTGFNALLWIAALFAFLAYKPFGDPQPDPTK